MRTLADELRVHLRQARGEARLHVTAADGRQIGWYEPRTGRHVLTDRALAGRFWAAVGSEAARLRALGESTCPPVPAAMRAHGAQAVRDDPDDAPTVASHDRRPVIGAASRLDLASNRPGAAALAQARRLRRAHPLPAVLGRALGIRTQARSFAIGARGERRVGRRLNRWAAARGWRVLHAVPAGRHGRDIDHLVIGPFGVVTVNTKNTAGQVWVGEHGMTVGGLKVAYLRAARAEASHAAARLVRATGMAVPVAPAIVFCRAPRFTVRRGGPGGVAVLPNPRALLHWLAHQPRVLGRTEMEQIYLVARDQATWAG